MPAQTGASLRFTRRTLLAGGLGGAALLALPPARATASPAGDPVAAIVAHVNGIRTSRGLAALPIDHHLARVASSWSARMAGGVGLAHNPDHRGDYGWPTDRAGEVVAYAQDARADAEQLAATIVSGWMASSSHRAILLGGSWTDMGVGCAWAPDGRLYATANTICSDLPAAGAEALALSTELIAAGGAPRMALARCDVAADALAGTALLGPQSPLLLVRQGHALPASVLAEISRAATAQTRVYLVGGGLGSVVEEQVRATGAVPVRLAGPSRYDTAALVATESAAVRQAPERILLVQADAWADAVSVGGQAATHAAAVLPVDRNAVPHATRQFLQAHPDAERIVIGGSGGIGDAVVEAVHGRRVAGSDRAGTGVAVMKELWGRTQASPGDPFVVTPGWTADGWATALAHTSWASAHAAPLLFSADGVPHVVHDALLGAGYASGASGVTRFARHVSNPVQQAFRAVIGG